MLGMHSTVKWKAVSMILKEDNADAEIDDAEMCDATIHDAKC